MIKMVGGFLLFPVCGIAIGCGMGWLFTSGIRSKIEAAQFETESFYEEIYCFKAPQGSSEWFAARAYLKRYRPDSLTCNFPQAKEKAND